VERVDLKVARTVGLDQRSLAGRWTAHFAEIGDQPLLVALSLSVAAIGAVRRDERMARTGLRMLAAHSLAGMGKLFGKDLVDRTRPGALREKAYRFEEGDSRDGRLRSMPSGHSAGAAAVAGAIVADYPAALVPLGLAATAIGAAQLPSRNHFLSDVIAGAALGLAATAVARLLIPLQNDLDQSRD